MAKIHTFDISKYKADPELNSFGARSAHFLAWAADKYPGMFFHPAAILQGITGLSRPPRSNAVEVQSIRNCMPSTQKYLMTTFKRGLVSEPEIGYRATTDAEDVVRNTVVKKAARFNSARKHLQLAVELVNPKELPNTEEGRQLKAYYLNVRDGTKALFSPEFERRLLPPSNPLDTPKP